MTNVSPQPVMLKFCLDVQDNWPPVAVESLPFVHTESGYTVGAAPLFVKDLSVNDVINVTLDNENFVQKWAHVLRSPRTTVWLLRLKIPNGIEAVLVELRELGCNSVGLEVAGCYAVDVPETIDIEIVDKILARLDNDAVGIAFPSMRHPE